MTYKFFRFFLAVSCFLVLNIHVQAEPLNLDLLRQNIEAYHDSGAYDRDLRAVARNAIRYINQRTAFNQYHKHPKKLAIVLDIDETSLSNYSQMRSRHFVGTKTQLVEEIHAADFPAIKPILEVYRDALQHHVAVFFVTGRKEPERRATIANLKKAGFTHWSGIYFKPTQYNNKSVIPYKSRARAAIYRKGYTIIASIGDQCSDLKGGYTEAGFKLPNPFYYLP